MTLTPEQLRENDYTADELRKYAADSDDGAHLDPSEAAIILRAHAAALEELARANYATRRAVERAERAEAALAASERKCERLKFHAEAMAVAWEKLDFDDGESEDAMEESVFAYRAYMGEE